MLCLHSMPDFAHSFDIDHAITTMKQSWSKVDLHYITWVGALTRTVLVCAFFKSIVRVHCLLSKAVRQPRANIGKISDWRWDPWKNTVTPHHRLSNSTTPGHHSTSQINCEMAETNKRKERSGGGQDDRDTKRSKVCYRRHHHSSVSTRLWFFCKAGSHIPLCCRRALSRLSTFPRESWRVTKQD